MLETLFAFAIGVYVIRLLRLELGVVRAAAARRNAARPGFKDYWAGSMLVNAARGGDAEAQWSIGEMYAVGEGLRQNDRLAVFWFKRSARHGNAQAQYRLGLAFRDGKGVPKDRAKAQRLWEKAAAQGHADARKELDGMDAQEQGQRRRGGQEKQEQRQERHGGGMTRAEALEILDLKEGAKKAEITAAFRRLMQNVHPDKKGGSNFFAKQLNTAYKVLKG